MGIKNITYKIGERVFRPEEITEVAYNGIRFTLHYTEEYDGKYRLFSVTCPSEDVEVVIVEE